jgi:hypothetical protein
VELTDMLLPTIVLIVLALCVLAYIAAPVLRSDAAERERVVSANSEAVDLQSRHAMLVAALSDLEEDRATGKMDEDDHRQLEASLTAQAVEIMKKIDALPDSSAAEPPLGPRPLDPQSDRS